jgi:protocatechuate 3,4-dioxygenase beta subunit
LNAEKEYRPENRGGNGIVTLEKKDNLLLCKRDIILGLNIPNYPIR